MISAQDLIERTLAAAAGTECTVVVEDGSQANLRWANSTLTTNGQISYRKVTVLVYLPMSAGMAVGAAARADLSVDEIPGVIAEAKAAAKAAGPAADYAPLVRDVQMGDWSAPHPGTDASVFGASAPALGDMFARSVSDGIELFGYAEHTIDTVWLGSSGGLRLRYDQPNGRVEMTGKSHGRSRSTWEGRATRDFSNIDIAEVDGAIRQKLEWQARRVDLPAGRYETVLPAGATADLMFYMLWMMDARSAMEGRSAFAKSGGGTRIGDRLAALPIDLYCDPAYPGMESAPFHATTASSPLSSVFDNGLAAERTNLVTAGVLTALAQTRATAAKFGMPYAGLTDSFVMADPNATATEADLIAGVQDGLLLNTLWYIRMVDPSSLLVTGLTRDGVYQVKGGEVVAAVNNYRWNESPVELLNRINAVSRTEITQNREWAEYVNRTAFPAIRVSDFNMSTVSQAN